MSYTRLWARKFAPYTASIFMEAFLSPSGFAQTPNKLFVPEGSLYAIYYDKDEYNHLVKRYTAFLMKQKMSDFAMQYEQQFADFLTWAKEVNTYQFNNFTNDQLANLLQELSKAMIPFSEMQFLAFVVVDGPSKTVEQGLLGSANGAHLLQCIATTSRLTKINKAHLELLEMVRDQRTDDKDLEQYIKEYAWLPVYEFIDKPLSVAEVREQIETINNAASALTAYENERAQWLHDYNQYFQSITDPERKQLTDVVHTFAYLKEMRDDYRRHAYFLLQPFWREVAKRTQMSFIDTNYLLTDELLKCLRESKNLYADEITKRRSVYSLVLDNGVLQVFDHDLSTKYLGEVSAEHSNEVTGATACKGKAIGKAKIVYHRGEFGDFEQGDILITAMTHPEFLHIMKKAAAVVTDEGGITCHAAITSRELNIPCVIGTKFATKAFKDGDMIEVDADRGIVRKI